MNNKIIIPLMLILTILTFVYAQPGGDQSGSTPGGNLPSGTMGSSYGDNEDNGTNGDNGSDQSGDSSGLPSGQAGDTGGGGFGGTTHGGNISTRTDGDDSGDNGDTGGPEPDGFGGPGDGGPAFGGTLNISDNESDDDDFIGTIKDKGGDLADKLGDEDLAEDIADKIEEVVGSRQPTDEKGVGDTSDITFNYNPGDRKLDFNIDETGDADVTIEVVDLQTKRSIQRSVGKSGEVNIPTLSSVGLKINDNRGGIGVLLPVDTGKAFDFEPTLRKESKFNIEPPEQIIPSVVQTIDVDVQLVSDATITFSIKEAGVGPGFVDKMKAYKCEVFDSGSGECLGDWQELKLAVINLQEGTVTYIVGKEFSTFMLGIFISEGDDLDGTLEELGFTSGERGQIGDESERQFSFYIFIILSVLGLAFFIFIMEKIHDKEKESNSKE